MSIESPQEGSQFEEVRVGPRTYTIPKEWEITQIGEIADVEYGKSLPESDGETPAVGSSGVYDTVGDSLIQQDTIVIGRKGSAGEAYLVRGACWPSDTTFYLTELDSDLIDIEFLHYYMCYNSLAEEIEQTTLPSLDRNRLETYRILTPPLPEQRRIADILSTVDEQIQQTDKTIEKTKELKKGLMQDLLHRGIGHDEFKEMYIGPKRSTLPVDWDVVQLGEIADIQSGSTQKRNNDEYWDDGTVPWIKSGEFNDRVVAETEEYITEQALEETGCIVFPEGTLLIALYGKGTVSKTARLGIDAATNQAIAGLLPESGAFNPRYLQYYLIDSRDTLLNVTVNPSSDTGRTNIYMSALRQFKVALPPLEEQEAIADRIAAVEDKVSDEVGYKQYLQELKRGLMQDLLTGKVRVSID